MQFGRSRSLWVCCYIREYASTDEKFEKVETCKSRQWTILSHHSVARHCAHVEISKSHTLRGHHVLCRGGQWSTLVLHQVRIARRRMCLVIFQAVQVLVSFLTDVTLVGLLLFHTLGSWIRSLGVRIDYGESTIAVLM